MNWALLISKLDSGTEKVSFSSVRHFLMLYCALHFLRKVQHTENELYKKVKSKYVLYCRRSHTSRYGHVKFNHSILLLKLHAQCIQREHHTIRVLINDFMTKQIVGTSKYELKKQIENVPQEKKNPNHFKDLHHQMQRTVRV